MQGRIHIPRSKIIEGDTLSLMLLAWCVDEAAFKEAFIQEGIEVNDEKDVAQLHAFHANGMDVKGALKDAEGNPVKFDVMETFSTIMVENVPEKIKACRAKIVEDA